MLLYEKKIHNLTNLDFVVLRNFLLFFKNIFKYIIIINSSRKLMWIAIIIMEHSQWNYDKIEQYRLSLYIYIYIHHSNSFHIFCNKLKLLAKCCSRNDIISIPIGRETITKVLHTVYNFSDYFSNSITLIFSENSFKILCIFMWGKISEVIL